MGGVGGAPGGERPSPAQAFYQKRMARDAAIAEAHAAKKAASQAKVEARKEEVKERAARMLEQERWEEEREFEQEKLDKMYELYKQRTMKPVWRIP